MEKFPWYIFRCTHTHDRWCFPGSHSVLGLETSSAPLLPQPSGGLLSCLSAVLDGLPSVGPCDAQEMEYLAEGLAHKPSAANFKRQAASLVRFFPVTSSIQSSRGTVSSRMTTCLDVVDRSTMSGFSVVDVLLTIKCDAGSFLIKAPAKYV